MAKKVQDFRAFDQTEKKATPTEKVGVVSEKRIKKENREEKKKSGLSLGFIIFFIILVVIGVSIGILFSPTFNLEEVEIADGVNVTGAEISNVIEVDYGINIFRQKYKTIKNNVLSLPYIKDAKVKIVFPNKLRIEYVEREPYLLLRHLESYYVADKFGYLLEIKKSLPEGNTLPIVYGFDVSSYEKGNCIDDTEGIKYKNIVMLLETANKQEFPYKIYEINYESIGEVKLWVENFDIDIIYGEIDKNLITDKLNYLSNILARLNGKKGKLDLSSDNYLEKTIFTERYE